jgi:hypothetical protein
VATLCIESPSAGRLHFGSCPNGGMELAKVGLHDDYSII